MGHRRADPQQVLGDGDPPECRDGLDVDEVWPAGDAQLHRQEELGAAGVHGRVLAVPLPQGDRFGHRGRRMDVKSAQDQAQAPPSVLRGHCIRYTVAQT